MPRVRVYGVEIPEMHVPRLVGGLTKTGTPEALAAAAQIAGAPDRNNSAGRLTPDMRDAILAVLSASQQPLGLRPLRQALAQDHEARKDS